MNSKSEWKSQQLTTERREEKNGAHAARQDFARTKMINDDILRGSRRRKNLSNAEKTLLAEFESGSFARTRDDCDAAFGWNKAARDAADSAAARVGR